MQKPVDVTAEVPANDAQGGEASLCPQKQWVSVPEVDPSTQTQGCGALNCWQTSQGDLLGRSDALLHL